jgi:hypothetical protein
MTKPKSSSTSKRCSNGNNPVSISAGENSASESPSAVRRREVIANLVRMRLAGSAGAEVAGLWAEVEREVDAVLNSVKQHAAEHSSHIEAE